MNRVAKLLPSVLFPIPALSASRSTAIERLLAARQSANLNRSREPGARRLLGGTAKIADTLLLGREGDMLVAFDFRENSIGDRAMIPGR